MKRVIFYALGLVTAMICILPAEVSADRRVTGKPRPTTTTTPPKKRTGTPAKPPTRTETKPTSTSSRLKRHLLYTLRPDEELGVAECNIGLKGDAVHYVAIIKNNKLNKTYLIHDGVKKIVADQMLCQYLDPVDFNNSVYQYLKDGQVYTFIEGRSFGPNRSDYTYVGGGMDDTDYAWADKGLYRGDDAYYYYGQRLVPPIRPNYGFLGQGPDSYEDTIQSLNKKHMAIQNEFKSITVDGKRCNLLSSMPASSDVWCYRAIYGDGTCAVQYRDGNNIYGTYVIKDGNVTKVGQDEYFNYRLCKIVPKDVSPTVNSFWIQEPYAHDMWMYDDVRLLHDKSGNHTLETSGLYKYVLIDNRPYGKECALGIWYDPKRDEFRWTAIEGKEIVAYTYKL